MLHRFLICLEHEKTKQGGLTYNIITTVSLAAVGAASRNNLLGNANKKDERDGKKSCSQSPH